MWMFFVQVVSLLSKCKFLPGAVGDPNEKDVQSDSCDDLIAFVAMCDFRYG